MAYYGLVGQNGQQEVPWPSRELIKAAQEVTKSTQDNFSDLSGAENVCSSEEKGTDVVWINCAAIATAAGDYPSALEFFKRVKSPAAELNVFSRNIAALLILSFDASKVGWPEARTAFRSVMRTNGDVGREFLVVDDELNH